MRAISDAMTQGPDPLHFVVGFVALGWRAVLIEIGSETFPWHIACGPSAMQSCRGPILYRLSSDFMQPDGEPDFSKTRWALDRCRRASEPSANHSREVPTLKRSLTDCIGPSEGVTFSRWVRRLACVISHLARLRLKQAGSRSFVDCRRILFGLIASQLFPRRARD